MSSPYAAVPQHSDVSREDAPLTSYQEHDAPEQYDPHGRVSPPSPHSHLETPPLAPPKDEAESGHDSTAQTPGQPRRRRHYLAALIFLLYLAFLVVPWVLACFLSSRPFGYPSYYQQNLSIPSDAFSYSTKFWVGFIDTANAVAFLITIPVISALLARGALVYFEHEAESGSITFGQAAGLADRIWTSPLFSSGRNVHTLYSLGATLLILISIIQVPLRAALVEEDTIVIPTFNDTGSYPQYNAQSIAAYDLEPWSYGLVPLANVVSALATRLSTTSESEVQPYMWFSGTQKSLDVPGDNMLGSTTLGDVMESPYSSVVPQFWAAAVPVGIQTGILNEHALGFQSDAACKLINQSAFPSNCSGSLPFTVDYQNTNISVKLCVPGNFTTFPWTLSRDEQSITEDLYMYISAVRIYGLNSNTTFHCQATTNRSYFELPNDRNNGGGNKVTTWPQSAEDLAGFNDYSSLYSRQVLQSPSSSSLSATWHGDTYPYSDTYQSRQQVPGPLMTTALALFGNNSFFDRAIHGKSAGANETEFVRQLCLGSQVPFTDLYRSWNNVINEVCGQVSDGYTAAGSTPIDAVLGTWLSAFGGNVNSTNPDGTTGVMRAALFLANDVTIQQTMSGIETYDRRAITTRAGTAITKPSVSLGVMVGLSALIGLQVFLLLALMVYIYHRPAWTSTMDAMMMAKLGQRASEHMMPVLGAAARWQAKDKVYQAQDGSLDFSPVHDHQRTNAHMPDGKGFQKRFRDSAVRV